MSLNCVLSLILRRKPNRTRCICYYPIVLLKDITFEFRLRNSSPSSGVLTQLYVAICINTIVKTRLSNINMSLPSVLMIECKLLKKIGPHSTLNSDNLSIKEFYLATKIRVMWEKWWCCTNSTSFNESCQLYIILLVLRDKYFKCFFKENYLKLFVAWQKFG